MSYSLLSYFLLSGVIFLILYVAGRAKVKNEERQIIDQSKYSKARLQLNEGEFSHATEIMDLFLKEKAKKIEDSAKERANKLIKRFARLSRGKNIDLADLAQEYTLFLEDTD